MIAERTRPSMPAERRNPSVCKPGCGGPVTYILQCDCRAAGVASSPSSVLSRMACSDRECRHKKRRMVKGTGCGPIGWQADRRHNADPAQPASAPDAALALSESRAVVRGNATSSSGSAVAAPGQQERRWLPGRPLVRGRLATGRPQRVPIRQDPVAMPGNRASFAAAEKPGVRTAENRPRRQPGRAQPNGATTAPGRPTTEKQPLTPMPKQNAVLPRRASKVIAIGHRKAHGDRGGCQQSGKIAFSQGLRPINREHMIQNA